MIRLSQVIFFAFLIAVFILEGTGFSNAREIVYFLIVSAPFFLFFLDFFQRKPIYVPKKLSFLFALFIIFSITSTILSVNVQRSFEYFLFNLSLILSFIYVFNHQKEIKKFLIYFLYGLAIFFSLYSLLVEFFLQQKWLFLFPQSAYNLVYPNNPLHNHLGDFLILPITISLYFFLKKKFTFLALISLAFFLPFFIFSFSRSAYLALGLTSLVMVIYLFSLRNLATVFILLIPVIFFMLTVSQAKRWQSRDFFANRDKYIGQAFLSIKEKPLFGVGLNNFIFASKRHAGSNDSWSLTSHNLFLDIFSENGGLAGIVFAGIIFLLFKNFQKSLFCFAALALFLNFQTDYTFNIYSLFLLFFVLAAAVYDEKKFKTNLPLYLSIVIVLFIGLIILSNFFLKKKQYKMAWLVYPLNKAIYQSLIEEAFKVGKFKTGLEQERLYLGLYENFFRGDSQTLFYIGKEYLIRYNQRQKAEEFFKQAIDWDPTNKILRQNIVELTK